VGFKLFNALFPKAVGGFALNQAVGEVDSCDTPILGHLLRTHPLLPGQDVCTDLFAVASVVRSSAQHHFVTYHAESEVVCAEVVILAAHDFGRHLTRSAAGVLCVLLDQLASDPHVGQFDVTVAVNHKILRLEIPVDNVVCM